MQSSDLHGRGLPKVIKPPLDLSPLYWARSCWLQCWPLLRRESGRDKCSCRCTLTTAVLFLNCRCKPLLDNVHRISKPVCCRKAKVLVRRCVYVRPQIVEPIFVCRESGAAECNKATFTAIDRLPNPNSKPLHNARICQKFYSQLCVVNVPLNSSKRASCRSQLNQVPLSFLEHIWNNLVWVAPLVWKAFPTGIPDPLVRQSCLRTKSPAATQSSRDSWHNR